MHDTFNNNLIKNMNNNNQYTQFCDTSNRGLYCPSLLQKINSKSLQQRTKGIVFMQRCSCCPCVVNSI